MSQLTTVICFSLTIFQLSESARVLGVFSFPSKSHQAIFRVLTDALLERGHEVVVVTTDPGYPRGATPQNLTEIDVNHVTYSEEMKKIFAGIYRDSIRNPKQNKVEIAEHLLAIFLRQLQSEEFQKLIKEDNQFDLVMLEPCVQSSYILSHLIKAPTIFVNSMGSLSASKIMGAPGHEYFYPSVFRRRTFNMSIWEQIYDIYRYNLFENQFLLEDSLNLEFRRIVGHDSPTLSELTDNINFMLMNQYFIWEGIRPIPTSFAYLGGIQIKPGKVLPLEWQTFFNSSTNGVIYVSFGTAVSPALFPSDKLQVMVNVLSQIPYDVVWKWDGELPNKGSNIKIFKWVPQADLLKHQKMRLFITQGGLHSTDEAIDAGVPVIGIPMISDQFFNSENYERFNVGLKLDLSSLTEEKMKQAVMEAITNESYRNNMIQLRNLLQDQPVNSLSAAVSWVEYIIRQGGAEHLRATAANMNWTLYYELELILIVLIVLFVIIFVIANLFLKLYRTVRKICKM